MTINVGAFDDLTIDDCKDLLAKVEAHYVSAVGELNHLRSMLEHVKHEDLCSTVQEREMSLKNDADIAHQQVMMWMGRYERLKARCIKAKVFENEEWE